MERFKAELQNMMDAFSVERALNAGGGVFSVERALLYTWWGQLWPPVAKRGE
jgi:hypothetical protein